MLRSIAIRRGMYTCFRLLCAQPTSPQRSTVSRIDIAASSHGRVMLFKCVGLARTTAA